jgi:hypothetical protein
MRSRATWIAVFAALNLCVCVVATVLDNLDYSNFSRFFEAHKRAFFCLAANLFCISMLAPMASFARSLGRDIAAVLTGTRQPKRWKAAAHLLVTWIVLMTVLALAFAEIVLMNVNLLPDEPALRLAILAVLVTVAVIGWKRFQRLGRAAGYRFNEALKAEKRQARARPSASTTLTVPGDFYSHIVIPSGSPAVGETIRSLDIRAKTGASVVAVSRGDCKHGNPGPDWCFAPGDTVEAIGDPKQLASLKDLLGVVAVG